MKKAKRIELSDGSQLRGELSHTVHRANNQTIIIVQGEICPSIDYNVITEWRKLRGVITGKKSDLFELRTGWCEVARVNMPSYEIKAENLWCPDLQAEIIEYLNYLKKNSPDRSGKRLFRSSVNYVLSDLKRPAANKIAEIGNGCRLIGPLLLKSLANDLIIAGDIINPKFLNMHQAEFFKIANIFACPDASGKKHINFIKLSANLWNSSLEQLIIDCLRQTREFTAQKRTVENAIEHIVAKRNRSHFISQLSEVLRNADGELLHRPEVKKILNIIAQEAEKKGLKLDLSLLAHEKP